MKDSDYKFVNDHILSEEELNNLIREKFQRMQQQHELERRHRKEVDSKYRSMILSY